MNKLEKLNDIDIIIQILDEKIEECKSNIRKNNFKLDKLTIDLKIVNIDIVLNNNDKEAAWLMYVELNTRVATQR